MKIETIQHDTEEVRVTTDSKTYVFTRSGFAGTSTGGGATLEELKEIRALTQEHPNRDVQAILGLSWRDYRIA